MAKIVEVAVIGAGMFGAAASKYLSREGADVLVIGPGEPVGTGQVSPAAFSAHFDEARICRRLGWDEVWAALDARSLERFRDIETESGIAFFRDCGSLVLLAKSIHHRTTVIVDQCHDEGIPVERLTEPALRAEFPALGLPRLADGVEGLLERTHAGYLNPRKLVAAQLVLTDAAGGRRLRGAVHAISKDRGLWKLQVVHDDGGIDEITAEKVLIATGALTNETGVLPEGRRLTLRAFTEPNLLFELSDSDRDRLQTLPPVVTVDPRDVGDANMSLYMLPPIRYPDGRCYMRIGPGMQPFVQPLRSAAEMIDWYTAQQITARQARFLTDAMETMVPGLRPASARQACCIIEKTATRYPYIGHLDDDDDSLTVAVGGNGHGARGSDEIGRLAANTVLGKPWDCPIPENTFTPVITQTSDCSTQLDGLKPPFGLC
ncbi:FAD-binding oxidoreductase [Nocardia vinacea]|uniref:NAD(P)/FAD-dependent oxidoreductase n=1 Tax=Nocardia vinacea TaxID=96468 RepID=UPI002E1469BE|nr:FAD-binding oxidoreductase [Nocardia vinacea]